MQFISDIFLAAGAFSAAIYCMVLARRLKKLRGLDQDLGAAIAVLSRQVDEMTRLLTDAQKTARASADQLGGQTERAEAISGKLEVLLSAFDDFEMPGLSPAPRPPREQPHHTDPQDASVFRRSAPRVEAAE